MKIIIGVIERMLRLENMQSKILIIDKTKWIRQLAERVNKDLHRVLHDDN